MRNELIVFEENGQLLTDSRDIALMTEKVHKNLLADIRGYIMHLTSGDFSPLEYFVESTYIDSKGETRPCYLCTKKGCDMIANKMIGKKGVIFTARYIEAFEKMREFIEQGKQINNSISFREQVECVGVVADILKINDASKLLMIGTLYKSYNLPSDFLPKYELNGSRELKSATELLKRNNAGISALKFNELMVEMGFLEVKTRKSKSKGSKEFKALTDKGLKYGENAISPHNQRETQPLYYTDVFMTLVDIIINDKVA